LVNNVGREQTGAVMAVNTLAQNLGSSIGSQVAVTIVVAKSAGGDISPGYAWAFAVAAAAAGLAFLACSLVIEPATTAPGQSAATLAGPDPDPDPGPVLGPRPAPPELPA
jgi:hypothetical protein